MKKLLVNATVAVTMLVMAMSAHASSIGFGGVYQLTDNNANGITETLSFINGTISTFDAGDGLFQDVGDIIPGINTASFETIVISNLILDEADLFNFDPTVYADGFSIFDDNGDLLLMADLTATNLEISGAGGSINTAFSLNLTGITAGAGYVAGTSLTVDNFLAAEAAGTGGATAITLQFAGNLANAIQDPNNPPGAQITNTYSGTAAPVPVPVPEPATLLLFGAGLIGIGTRRHFKKASV